MDNRLAKFHAVSGAAIIELVVVLPALLVLGLGVLQSALFYQAKTTISYATFEAARKGATTHAQKSPMLDEFGIRIAPIYGGDGSTAKVLAAITKGRQEARTPSITELDILNPTKSAFVEFGVNNAKTGQLEIPNSHLQYRDPTVIGAKSLVNIQDANLLKIKATYGYQLKVPIVNTLITAALSKLDQQNNHYYSQGRIPLTAVATVRMQSTAWEDSNITAVASVAGAGQLSNSDPGDAQWQGGDLGAGQYNAYSGSSSGSAGSFGLGGGLSSGNQCDVAVQSCVDTGANLGNPNSCESAGDAKLTSTPIGLPALNVGNPINVVTGNKFQREIDIPGLSGPAGIRWERSYNSQTSQRGVLGAGWRHYYAVALRPVAQGLLLTQGDGRKIIFSRASATKYTATLVKDGVLIIEGQGENAQHLRGSGGSKNALPVIRWQLPSKRMLTFNTRGQLTDITSADGQSTQLQYNSNHRLLIVRDQENNQLTLSYYRNGRMKNVVSNGGHHFSYRYDRYANLAEVVYADGSSKRYIYDDPYDRNNLTATIDRLGVQYARWAYDDKDRAISSTHANGVDLVSIDYQDDGVRIIRNSAQEPSTYFTGVRKGYGIVTAIQGPGCSSCSAGDSQYKYTDDLQLSEILANDGSTTFREYDDKHRLAAIFKQQAGFERRLLTRFSFKGDALSPSSYYRPSINPDGYHSVHLDRDDTDNIVRITEEGYAPDHQGGFNKMRRSTRYGYNKNGQLIMSDGPAPGPSDRVEYLPQSKKAPHPASLSASNRQPNSTGGKSETEQRIVAPGGQRYTLVYGQDNRLAHLKSEQGKVLATLRYDAKGNIIALKGNKGEAKISYDGAGRMTNTTGAQGQHNEFSWSDEGRLQRHTQYDTAGNIATQKNYAYTAMQQLASITDLDGKTEIYRYNDHRQLLSYTDKYGRQSHYSYQKDGLRASTTRLVNTNEKTVEKTKYDVHGNVVERTDARGNTSYWAYDDFGHLLYKSNPDRGLVMYRYDAFGNVIARVDENAVITRFEYNDNGQLIGIAAVDEPATTTFEYQRNGAPKRSKGLNQTTEYTIEQGPDKSHIVERTVRIHALNQEYVTRYQLDNRGALSAVTLPAGQTLHYATNTHDNSMAISSEGRFFDTALLSVARDDHGRLLTLDYGDSSTHYSYNESNQLGSLKALSGDNALSQKTYRYTDSAQIHQIDEQVMAGASLTNTNHAYNYDLQGRLVSAKQGTAGYSWQYDLVGNRVASKTNTLTSNNQYYTDSNKLVTVNSQHIKYLPTGELSEEGDYRYEYNVGHRLSAVYKGDKLIARYEYNAEGERIQKTDYRTTMLSGNDHRITKKISYYLYENKKLQAELDEHGVVQRQYLYDKGLLIGLYDKSNFYAVHSNHLGAPELLTNEDGDVVWQASYDPFGKATVHVSTITLNIRLPGQYYDDETGLHYNMYRSYNPDTGRYLSSDPLGVEAGFNTYTYVKNDPLNRVDPLGLYDELVHYYMTYFLAITAGLSAEEALIMALATQYVDDNPLTNPIPNKTEIFLAVLGGATGLQNEFLETAAALSSYHFTLDYDNGRDGDSVSRKDGETDEEYALRRVRNPQSEQLGRLHDAALFYDRVCLAGDSPYAKPESNQPTAAETKAQLYGEYLHAFEDTFAHRDRHNKPLSILNTTGGIGHALLGHSPDHTYNQLNMTDPHYTQPGGKPKWSEPWAYNEARTLQMEYEVFQKIQDDFNVTSNISWSNLAGTGDAPIGLNRGQCDDCWVNGEAPRFESSADIGEVLQRFNAYNENAEGNSKEAKVAILNEWLKNQSGIYDEDGNPIIIPSYSKTKAKSNRDEVIGD